MSPSHTDTDSDYTDMDSVRHILGPFRYNLDPFLSKKWILTERWAVDSAPDEATVAGMKHYGADGASAPSEALGFRFLFRRLNGRFFFFGAPSGVASDPVAPGVPSVFFACEP